MSYDTLIYILGNQCILKMLFIIFKTFTKKFLNTLVINQNKNRKIPIGILITSVFLSCFYRVF